MIRMIIVPRRSSLLASKVCASLKAGQEVTKSKGILACGRNWIWIGVGYNVAFNILMVLATALAFALTSPPKKRPVASPEKTESLQRDSAKPIPSLRGIVLPLCFASLFSRVSAPVLSARETGARAARDMRRPFPRGFQGFLTRETSHCVFRSAGFRPRVA